MIIREYYMTRSDGVNLYRTIDAVVNEFGEPILDENGKLIPTGKMIMQLQTGVEYDEAIDVEDASYTYIETDKDIVKEEEAVNEEQ